MPKRMTGWFHVKVGIELDNLADYITAMDIAIEQGKAILNERYEEDIANHGEENREHIMDLYTDESWQWTEPFPQMLWTSYFIASYSYLEHLMSRMCIYIGSRDVLSKWRKKHKKEHENLSYIGKYRKYLEEECQIDFSDQEAEWEDINLWFREARNTVAHAGGEIDPDDLLRRNIDADAFVKFIRLHGGTVDVRYSLIVSKEFDSYFRDILVKFISKLLEKIPPKV